MDSDRHKTGFRIDDILKREVLKDDTHFMLSNELPSASMDFAIGHNNFKDNVLKWTKTDDYSCEELLLHQGSYYRHTNHLCNSTFHPYSNSFGVYPPSQQYSNITYNPYLPYFLPHPGLVISGYQSRRKGGQIRFTADQTKCLENKFENVKYLSPDDRRLLAMDLKLSDRQVKTWFQNRRAKWRRFCNGCLPTTVSDSHDDGSRNCKEVFEAKGDVLRETEEDCKSNGSL